jgi:hypothetical protein
MWLYLIAGILFVVGVIGGLAGGGIFSIVLIPLALVTVGASALFSGGGRAEQRSAGKGANETHPTDRPLPHAQPQPSGRAPSSPERLADARRAQQ